MKGNNKKQRGGEALHVLSSLYVGQTCIFSQKSPFKLKRNLLYKSLRTRDTQITFMHDGF
jgi:hypothetical protein